MASKPAVEHDSPSAERMAYRPNELSAVLGVSRSRAFEMLRSGELRSIRYGRTRLVSRRAIDEFLGNESA